MHFNPCHERWRLAKNPSDYEHSSARFYQFGKQGKIELRDYQDFLALLLEMEEEEERKLRRDESPGKSFFTKTLPGDSSGK